MATNPRNMELMNSYSINEVPSSLQMRNEYNGDGSTLYSAFAIRGAASSDDVWTIFTYTYSNGQMTLKQTAYGSWDQRASLIYT